MNIKPPGYNVTYFLPALAIVYKGLKYNPIAAKRAGMTHAEIDLKILEISNKSIKNVPNDLLFHEILLNNYKIELELETHNYDKI